MATTYSQTTSHASTFTEARARHVMASVFDDLVGMSMTDLVSLDTVKRWQAVLTHVLELEALSSFQVQFRRPDGTPVGLEYRVSDDGTLSENSASGGINYHSLPKGTTTSLVLDLRPTAKRREEALAYLRKQGFTFDGVLLTETPQRDRAYSSDGYGLVRQKVGGWK